MERVSIAKSCWSVGERYFEARERRSADPASHSPEYEEEEEGVEGGVGKGLRRRWRSSGVTRRSTSESALEIAGATKL